MLTQRMKSDMSKKIKCCKELAVQRCSDIIQWWRDHRF